MPFTSSSRFSWVHHRMSITTCYSLKTSYCKTVIEIIIVIVLVLSWLLLLTMLLKLLRLLNLRGLLLKWMLVINMSSWSRIELYIWLLLVHWVSLCLMRLLLLQYLLLIYTFKRTLNNFIWCVSVSTCAIVAILEAECLFLCNNMIVLNFLSSLKLFVLLKLSLSSSHFRFNWVIYWQESIQKSILLIIITDIVHEYAILNVITVL